MLELPASLFGCYSSESPVQPAGAAPVTPGHANAITKNFAFSPAVLTIKKGTGVPWTNDDSVPHAVVSDVGSQAPFSSPNLATGALYQQTFTRTGTYSYHCSIHPSMKGTSVVEPERFPFSEWGPGHYPG